VVVFDLPQKQAQIDRQAETNTGRKQNPERHSNVDKAVNSRISAIKLSCQTSGTMRWLWLATLTCCRALMNIPETRLQFTDSVDFDVVSNSWVLPFQQVTEFTAIIPQLCHPDHHDECASSISTQNIMDCETVQTHLENKHWVGSSLLQYDNQSCPILHDPNLDISVEQTVYVTHPPALRIKKNTDILESFSSTQGNSTYSILVRALFIKEETNSLYQVHQVHKLLTLKVFDNVGGTLSVQHECRHRGLAAPPLSILAVVIDALGDHVCIWQCPLSHVRVPFNTAPPLATKMNTSDRVCMPLPDTFTAVQIQFNIYVQVSSTGVPMLTQAFYDDLNDLASLMEYDASLAWGDTMVILTVEGAVYGKTSIDEILLAHSINKHMYSNYETIKISQHSRRLLTVVNQGIAWVPVHGVMLISRTDLTDLQKLHQDVVSITSGALTTFVFDKDLKVEGTDRRVVIRSLHRGVAELPTTDTSTVAFSHEVTFYVVLLACAGVILAKCLITRTKTRRYH